MMYMRRSDAQRLVVCLAPHRKGEGQGSPKKPNTLFWICSDSHVGPPSTPVPPLLVPWRQSAGPAAWTRPSPRLSDALMLSHFQAPLQLRGAPIDSWSWRPQLRVIFHPHPLRRALGGLSYTLEASSSPAGQNQAEPNKPPLSCFSHRGKKKRNETLFCISGINKRGKKLTRNCCTGCWFCVVCQSRLHCSLHAAHSWKSKARVSVLSPCNSLRKGRQCRYVTMSSFCFPFKVHAGSRRSAAVHQH